MDLKEKKDRLNKLANEILKEEEGIAGEKTKHLVGKCYKYLNSYSDTEKWWLYIKILSCDRSGWFKAEKIQCDSSKKITFEPNELLHSFDGKMLGNYIEITPRVYNKAKERIARYVTDSIDQAYELWYPKSKRTKREEEKAKATAKRLVDAVMGKEKKKAINKAVKARFYDRQKEKAKAMNK